MHSLEQEPLEAKEAEIELVDVETEDGALVQTSENEELLKEKAEALRASDPSSDYTILPFGIVFDHENEAQPWNKKAGFSLWKKAKAQ